MPLPETSRELLRQLHPDKPRHTPYGTWWLYEPAPFTRGYDDGVRIELREDGTRGTVVGRRLKAQTLIVQVHWDNTVYPPGRCDFTFDFAVTAIGRGPALPLEHLGQLSLLDEAPSAPGRAGAVPA